MKLMSREFQEEKEEKRKPERNGKEKKRKGALEKSERGYFSRVSRNGNGRSRFPISKDVASPPRVSQLFPFLLLTKLHIPLTPPPNQIVNIYFSTYLFSYPTSQY